MLTPELSKLMKAKFNPDEASEALIALQSSPQDPRALERALNSLLPIMGRVVFSQKSFRSNDSNMFNEVVSECLFKLLEFLQGEKFLKQYEVIKPALMIYWFNVFRLTILGTFAKDRRQAYRESDPRVISVVTPLASSLPSAIYNRVLLSEIPEQVYTRSLAQVRFPGKERTACDIILKALTKGGNPPTFLLTRMKLVQPSNIAFLVDYCTVLVRKTLIDIRGDGTIFDEVTDSYSTSIWSLLVEEQDMGHEED